MSRYYPVLRPPTYAAVPDGWTDSQVWMPTQKIGSYNAGETDTDLHGIPAHGYVEYAEPLAIEVAWKFDLLPADRVERAWYWLYQDVVHNARWEQTTDYRAAVLRRAAKYRSVSDEDLEWMEGRDLWVAKTLRAHPDSAPLFKVRD